MAPSWTSPSRVFLILVLLYRATAQDTPSPTLAFPPNPDIATNDSGINTQSNETGAETTQFVMTTANITMAHQTSTMNISWIMSERDRFHDESERLRVAVIILGIFFAIAAVAIIIGLVWFFIIRRRSGSLKSENQAQQRTTAGQKTEAPQHNVTKKQANDNSANLNAKQKTDTTVQQQGKEPNKPNSASAASTSFERQSNPTDKVQLKGSPAIPKTNTGFYANTSSSQVKSVGNAGADEQEVYIELDEEKPTSDTSAANMSTHPNSSQRDSSTDEIYENFTPPSENYSQLDTENQYDHHYD